MEIAVLAILIPILLFFIFLYFNIKGLTAMWRDYNQTRSLIPLIFFIVAIAGIFTGVWTWIVVLIYYVIRPNR